MPLNPERLSGYSHRRRADGRNAAALHQYGLMGNDSLPIHRNQVDVDKCNRPNRQRERRLNRAQHLLP